MPRTCVHRKIGGSSGITRKRYSVLQKCQVVEYALAQQERWGTSVRNLALDVQVPHNVLARWCGQVVQLREQVKISSKSLSLCAGPVGQLEAVQDQLHTWLFEKREQGMAISITHIVWKAQKFIGPDFTDKSFNAKFMVTQRWLRKFAYVYRMRTNEATRAPSVVAGEASAFLLATRPSLVGPHRDKRYIFNMDQTPLWFSYHCSKTLQKRGAKTVHVRKSTDDTRRATAALTCNAAGDFLRPMIIFKGTANGRIVKTELPSFDPTSDYLCQKNAWMDERCMLIWADECLGSYLRLRPPPAGIVPVILLDSYRCHLMGSVVRAIQELGVEVIHIPGGCTGLLQPLDVGLNKPFKGRVRASWEEWMMVMIDNHGFVDAPTRDDISSWAASAHWDMDGTPMMMKAWKKTGYSWFEEDEPTADEGGVILDDEDVDDELEAMQEELDTMMDEEGMAVDIRGMIDEMIVSGVLMDDHDEDEHHEMWTMKVN